MTKGIITSESPEIHWEHLNVAGGRVLDLGCAFWTEAERQEANGTTKYFLSQKPEFYMGVDTNQQDITTLSSQYADGKLLCEMVSSERQIEGWIAEHKITHIKSDIEGAEDHLLKIKDVGSLKEIAIELHHSNENDFLDWFKQIGFECFRHDSVAFCPEISVIYGRLKC